MALNFPDTPALNESYTFNGTQWQWNGTAWSTANVMITARAGLGGAGNCRTCAIAFGGCTGPGGIVACSERFQ